MKRVANWNTLLAVVALTIMLVVGSAGSVLLAQNGQGEGEPGPGGSGRRAAGPEPFLVKDIYPEALGRIPFSSSPNFLTNFNGTLFFSAIDRTTGDELWKSDGTAAGTVLVKDINPGVGDSLPSILTDVNGTLFFTANDGANGFELWKSDGTAAGTVLVKDIWPGMFGPIPTSSAPANLTDVNGTLFFQCNDGSHGDELWKSDGTEAGTVLIKDINPGTIGPDPAGSAPENLTDVNGTLFFIANDGTNGYELWKSDGTEAGTVLVKDIDPGASGSFPSNLTDVDGTLFFIAADGTNGYELWKSDGTEAGTVLVKDIDPGASGSFPTNLTNVDGTLLFSSDDGPTGYELWKSDGTEAGTVLVKDIYPGTVGPYPYSSSPNFLTDVNGTLFFIANDGPTGNELWKSDGTAAGTVLVKDIYPGPEGSRSAFLTDVSGTLFFRADDGITGNELWKSNGTDAGTVLVGDIWSGTIGPKPAGSAPGNLTDVNGTLFFRANDGTTGNELWAVSSLGDDTRPPPMTADDASVFTPMTPERLVDTRIGYGTAKQRLQAHDLARWHGNSAGTVHSPGGEHRSTA